MLELSDCSVKGSERSSTVPPEVHVEAFLEQSLRAPDMSSWSAVLSKTEANRKKRQELLAKEELEKAKVGRGVPVSWYFTLSACSRL